mmetsp:Transcript_128594/g.372123  ORF Transcript_128594/g.372123 Transcript_128594/m.372123 type:complete len:241 (-) Transcript_128594:1310-2032(-)
MRGGEAIAVPGGQARPHQHQRRQQLPMALPGGDDERRRSAVVHGVDVDGRQDEVLVPALPVDEDQVHEVQVPRGASVVQDASPYFVHCSGVAIRALAFATVGNQGDEASEVPAVRCAVQRRLLVQVLVVAGLLAFQEYPQDLESPELRGHVDGRVAVAIAVDRAIGVNRREHLHRLVRRSELAQLHRVGHGVPALGVSRADDRPSSLSEALQERSDLCEHVSLNGVDHHVPPSLVEHIEV